MQRWIAMKESQSGTSGIGQQRWKATWDKQRKMGVGNIPINSKLSSSFNFREANSPWWTSGKPLIFVTLFYLKKS